jgi:sec-independent protein translocase protein TatC
VILLVKMNMVTVQKLKDFRGSFIVVAFVIAAVVTPPDVISQLALAVPMCLLYEAGIWGARWFVKSSAKSDEEVDKEEKTSA